MTVFAVLGLSAAVVVRHQTAHDLDTLMITLEAQKAQIDSLQARIAAAEQDEIGFVPCWRGPGEPKYYFTYDVTVTEDSRFSVKPHRDWRLGSDFRRQLGADLVSTLLDHPPSSVDETRLREFGGRVAEALVETDAYAQDCELAVTINDAATVAESAVVRRAGFYPVGRN